MVVMSDQVSDEKRKEIGRTFDEVVIETHVVPNSHVWKTKRELTKDEISDFKSIDMHPFAASKTQDGAFIYSIAMPNTAPRADEEMGYADELAIVDHIITAFGSVKSFAKNYDKYRKAILAGDDGMDFLESEQGMIEMYLRLNAAGYRPRSKTFSKILGHFPTVFYDQIKAANVREAAGSQ